MKTISKSENAWLEKLFERKKLKIKAPITEGSKVVTINKTDLTSVKHSGGKPIL